LATAPQSAQLPAPSGEALATSERLAGLIAQEIERANGWISFERYMALALYAPGLGYYMGGARKLGRDGDFVTAPETSALFGRALARQVSALAGMGLADVLEIGAGSGALAAELLLELERLGCPPRRYLILELSPDLRDRSRATLAARAPHLLDRVAWLNGLPPAFTGVVIGNEVLDAMPASIARRSGGRLEELGVTRAGRSFGWAARPAPSDLSELARTCFPEGGSSSESGSSSGRGSSSESGSSYGRDPSSEGEYQSEFQPAACGFIRALGAALEHGVALFFDYGFPWREYYHPQRAAGTLMCHYRHRAHDDPFFLPGLQDITVHVDFSAIARAGADAGLELSGYANQAQFLVNCGITDLLAETPAEDAAAYAPLAAQAQKLLSPAEMGELFKVIALSRGVREPLAGFTSGDRRHTL
jgi:SAM-dependent MidA family methyltransferase